MRKLEAGPARAIEHVGESMVVFELGLGLSMSIITPSQHFITPVILSFLLQQPVCKRQRKSNASNLSKVTTRPLLCSPDMV
jgi:hypothetical protein